MVHCEVEEDDEDEERGNEQTVHIDAQPVPVLDSLCRPSSYLELLAEYISAHYLAPIHDAVSFNFNNYYCIYRFVA
jgi:hypothetical protein